jgi:hypothetical protein
MARDGDIGAEGGRMRGIGRRAALACAGLGLSVWAWASGPSSAATSGLHARRALADGVVLDWTSMVLEVRAWQDDPLARTDNKPAEAEAMRQVDAQVRAVLGQLPVRRGVRLEDVRGPESALTGDPWSVVETRYYTGGPVEVLGRSEILPLVAAWQHARSVESPPMRGKGAAQGPVPAAVLAALKDGGRGKKKGDAPAAPPPPEAPKPPTGVVLDVRGAAVQPVMAPRILDATGAVLFDSVMWKDVAYSKSPVTWVGNPAASEAAIAGERPIFAMGRASPEGEIVVDEPAASELRAVSGERFFGAGSVVVVVDADG